jgi:DUF3040 family protein
MLSDAEQRRLAEIETVLRLDDPTFVWRFDAGWRMPGGWRVLGLVAVALAGLLTMAALTAGSLGTAGLGLCGVLAGAGVWATHRTTDRTNDEGN